MITQSLLLLFGIVVNLGVAMMCVNHRMYGRSVFSFGIAMIMMILFRVSIGRDK